MKKSALFPEENLYYGADYPCITYYRAGSTDKPLVIFIPGGGHLARVSYGHAGANKEDFLDYWLKQHGYGLLAISYPSDYPAFERVYPEMSISDWGRCISSIAAAIIEKNRLSPNIVVLAWSMSGKVVSTFAQTARRQGLQLVCFISLSATIPLPGISPRRTTGEPLTPQSLWDVEDSIETAMWTKELEQIGHKEGYTVISAEEYQSYYRCNNPIQLRGEVDRFQNGTRITSLKLALEDVCPFDYSCFPICLSIVPTYQSDAMHALTDGISWAFYSIYSIVRGKLAKCNFAALSQNDWNELRDIILLLPQRLTRYVAGGHLFYIGKTGAAITARFIEELILEATHIETTLRRFVD